MELVTLGLFSAVLIGSIVIGIPTLYALLVGLLLFCGYALLQEHSLARVAAMCWHGIKPICRILAMLVVVGMLTGLWRAAGVIPAIIFYAVPFITPPLFIVMTFLLNSLVSVLTGTSFGTAATMGAICISLAQAMGVPLVIAGGAALSGAFVGDRWSPISTSALLVANITGTSFYDNLKRMARTMIVPFIVTCAIYLAMGIVMPAMSTNTQTVTALGMIFDLNPLVLLPPVLVFVLALFRIDILLVLILGVVAAAPLCVLLQHLELLEVLRVAILGYIPPTPEVAALAGGGIVSMVEAIAIVTVTSAYAGIFEETNLLQGIERIVGIFAKRISVFAATLGISAVASMISCNQTLAIMLAHQLSRDLTTNASDHALDLEDSVVLVAGLVPWSIAGGVPLASMGAPVAGMAWAVFMYAVPIWRLIQPYITRRVHHNG